MKTIKSLIIFAAFLMMAATITNLYFLLDVDKPNKNVGAYVGVAAMLVMLFALVFTAISERKIRKLQQKIEEKDQEIGALQKDLEQTNEVINLVPNKDKDVPM